jgi:hypothetical protein
MLFPYFISYFIFLCFYEYFYHFLVPSFLAYYYVFSLIIN